MLDTMITVTVHGHAELVHVHKCESESPFMPATFEVKDRNGFTFYGVTVDGALEQLRMFYGSM